MVQKSVPVTVLMVLVVVTIPTAADGNENSILLWWPTHLLIHLREQISCNSIWIEAKTKSSAFYVRKCKYFGLNRFLVGGLQEDTYYSIRVSLVDTLHQIWSNDTRTLPAASPPVSSHAMRCGPGWVELRFPVPRAARPTLLGYAVSYKGRGAGAALYAGRVNWRTLVPSSLQMLPCPFWRKKGMFCVWLTDVLRWPSPDEEPSVYKFKGRTARKLLNQPEAEKQNGKGEYQLEERNRRQRMQREHPPPYRSYPSRQPRQPPPGQPPPGQPPPGQPPPGQPPPGQPPPEQPYTEQPHDDSAVNINRLWPVFLVLWLVMMLLVMPFCFILGFLHGRRSVDREWNVCVVRDQTC